jgi:hypothetical protein
MSSSAGGLHGLVLVACAALEGKEYCAMHSQETCYPSFLLNIEGLISRLG